MLRIGRTFVMDMRSESMMITQHSVSEGKTIMCWKVTHLHRTTSNWWRQTKKCVTTSQEQEREEHAEAAAQHGELLDSHGKSANWVVLGCKNV